MMSGCSSKPNIGQGLLYSTSKSSNKQTEVQLPNPNQEMNKEQSTSPVGVGDRIDLRV